MDTIDNLLKLSQVKKVAPATLDEHPLNDKYFAVFKTPRYIKDMHDSIKEYGIMEPIIISKDKKTIISGHTRVEVALGLNLKTIPVRYILNDLSPKDEIQIMIRLNVDSMMTTSKTRHKFYRILVPNFDKRIVQKSSQGKKKDNPISIDPEELASLLGISKDVIKKDFNCIKNRINYHKRKKETYLDHKINQINTKFIKWIISYLNKVDYKISQQNKVTIKETIDILSKYTKKLEKYVNRR